MFRGRIRLVVLVLSLAVTSLVAAATAPVYIGLYSRWDLKSFQTVRGIASWGRADGDDRQCAAGSPRHCMNFLSLLFKYCLQEVRLHVSPFLWP